MPPLHPLPPDGSPPDASPPDALPPDGSPPDGSAAGVPAGGPPDETAPKLGVLLVEHLPYVRAFLRLRLDGEFRARESISDLVQSVCREVLAHPRRFDYRSDKAFRVWLCNAALIKVREKRRFHGAAKRDVRREQAAQDEAAVGTIITTSFGGPVTAAIRAEEQERIERAFDLLTDAQREVLTLFRIVGLSHREIAERLGISVGNSRMILNRAMGAFAARWEELGGAQDP